MATTAKPVFEIAGHHVKLDPRPLVQSVAIKHDVPEAFARYEILRNAGQDFDATVTVGDEKMPGHKALLSARVPFFRGLFESSMAEATSGEVSISNEQFDAKTIEALLGYVYTGTITLNDATVFDTMVAANFLGIESVMDECAQFMRKRLHTGNALTLLQHCRHMGYHKIDDILHRFIDKNAYTISETDDFKALSVDELESFLRRSSLNVDSERQVFEMISRWMGEDKAKWAHAERLVRTVRPAHMSAPELAVVFNTMHWLTAAPAAKQLLDQAKASLGNPAALAALDAFDKGERSCDEAQQLVFVVGLTSAQQKPIESPMSFYDPIADEWRSCGKLRSQRGRNGVAIVDNKIYALGGFDGQKRLNTCEVYDTEKCEWDEIKPMKSGRAAMATGVVGGKILVAGGWCDQVGALNETEIYNPATEEWTAATAMSKKRATPASCVLNGMIYVIGGHDGQQIWKDGECYDPATQSWTPIAPMKHKRCRFGAAVYNGYIYVVGGFDGAAFLRDVERYNPATNTWEAVKPTKERRSRACVAVSSGRLFVFGGFDGLNNVSSVEMYQPEADRWVPRKSMPEHYGGVFAGRLPLPTTLASPVANLESDDVDHGSKTYVDPPAPAAPAAPAKQPEDVKLK